MINLLRYGSVFCMVILAGMAMPDTSLPLPPGCNCSDSDLTVIPLDTLKSKTDFIIDSFVIKKTQEINNKFKHPPTQHKTIKRKSHERVL